MGMPQVPDRDHVPSLSEVIVELVESVALEELAMAHLMNAEGEKLQEIIDKYRNCHVCYNQFRTLCTDTHDILNSLIMKEWIMLNKLTTAMSLHDQLTDSRCTECFQPRGKCSKP